MLLICVKGLSALSKKIEEYSQDNPYIDGKVLANAINLIFWTGLKKKELINLKIRDVVYKGRIREIIHQEGKGIIDELMTRRGKIPLFAEAKCIILNHSSHLYNRGYDTSRTEPLFQITNRSFKKSRSLIEMRGYDEGRMTTHLALCTKNSEFSGIRFKNIQLSGIYNFYKTLNDRPFNWEKSLQKTVEFSRCSYNYIFALITKIERREDSIKEKEAWIREKPFSIDDFKNKRYLLYPMEYVEIINSSCEKFFGKDKEKKFLDIFDEQTLANIKKYFFSSLDFLTMMYDDDKKYIKNYFEEKIY